MGILDKKEKDQEVISKKYALLVGAEENLNGMHLPGVVHDMREFAKILNDKNFSDFEVKPIDKPTVVKIKKAVTTISRKACLLYTSPSPRDRG